MTDWDTAFADDVELAERPLWDDRTESVVWVDCYGGAVHRLWEDGRHRVLATGDEIGAAGLRENGGLVVARGDGLLFLGPDGEPDREEILFGLPAQVRFNDGACDPDGRFLIGTCSTVGSRGQGALYSVERDGGVTELLSGITESNGLAWSLDGTVLYYVDSGEPEIRRHPYDRATGWLGTGEVLLAFSPEQGVADGLIVDAEGAIWAAMWEGSAVCRISPEGEILEDLAMPVSRPTCPAFGGAGLDQLYVTTAWEGMTAEERAAEPLAGSLLVTAPGARGLPPFRFAG